MNSGTHSQDSRLPVTAAITAPAMAGPKAPKIMGAGFMNSESTSAAEIVGDIDRSGSPV
jgi:hypothetical protein